MTVSYTARYTTSSDICEDAIVILEDGSMFAASPVSYNTTEDTIFHSSLNDLKPNQLYQFTAGCQATHQFTTGTFTTPPSPAPSQSAAPFSFIVFGDMGVADSAQSTVANIAADLAATVSPFSFVLHNGDISYARGEDDVWDTWFDLLEPVMNSLPYQVTPGNHDLLHSDSGGEDGIPYATRFKMPLNDLSKQRLYYSFTFNGVFFIQISTDDAYDEGSEQYNWLVAELQEVDRDVTPFVFVTGHKPMYCSSSFPTNERSPGGTSGNSGSLTKQLEPLFEKYGVDVYIGAHIHAYERTYPVTGNGTETDCDCVNAVSDEEDVYTNPAGVVNLNLGMSGANHLDETWSGVDWSARHFEEYGYARLQVINGTCFKVEFVANGGEEGAGDGPIVRDTLWVVKDAKYVKDAK